MKVKDTILDEIITKRITEVQNATLKIRMHSLLCEGARQERCSCHETVAVLMQVSRGVVDELQRLREQEI